VNLRDALGEIPFATKANQGMTVLFDGDLSH
jgi:hypothetical protein